MSLTEYSKTHLVQYPELDQMTTTHEALHWVPEEVTLSQDVEHWKTHKATPEEESLIKNILRLFTLSDVAIGQGYYDRLIPVIKNNEARMMLGSFAARERTHYKAYALLSDTLGFEEDFYFEFLDYSEMTEKYEFMTAPSGDSLEEFALYLARHMLIEGVSLFASFALLFNFDRVGLFPGMIDVVRWSCLDEACFDKTTEILTEGGWKLFQDLVETDKVAQYTPTKNQEGDIEFVYPQRIIKKHFEGNMVGFENRDVDQLLTPDHRVLFYYEDEEHLRELPAEEFVPHARKKFPVSGFKSGQKEFMTDLERLKVAFQADGSLNRAPNRTGELCGYRRAFFSLTKARKKERLNLLGKEFNILEMSRPKDKSEDARLFTIDFPVGEIPDKEFDWVDINEVSSSWCREFIDEIAEWDGYYPNEGSDVVQYSNTNRTAVEKVQLIATLAGYHTRAVWRVDNRKESYKDCCKLTIFKRQTQRMAAGSTKVTNVPYNGMVYCVTVPSGAVLIRRNEKISVSGNCHAQGNAALFKQFVAEHPYIINDDFKQKVYQTARDLVSFEEAFIDKCFEMGAVRGITTDEIKEYVRYIADYRLVQLGFKPNWGIERNPIPWTDALMVDSHGNLFERNQVAYQKDNLKGEWVY